MVLTKPTEGASANWPISVFQYSTLGAPNSRLSAYACAIVGAKARFGGCAVALPAQPQLSAQTLQRLVKRHTLAGKSWDLKRGTVVALHLRRPKGC